MIGTLFMLSPFEEYKLSILPEYGKDIYMYIVRLVGKGWTNDWDPFHADMESF